MVKSVLKKVMAICLVAIATISIFACKSKKEYEGSPVAPDVNKLSADYKLDFTDMHNYVIDTLSSQYTPFFYIKNGEFEISGDNVKKIIELKCTCMDGTTVEDLDLFLSMVLQYIGFNAAEQDYRFTAPKIDSTGTYLDFGTVFNTYGLALRCDTESGKILRKDDIKAGEKIPVDSRYWKE